MLNNFRGKVWTSYPTCSKVRTLSAWRVHIDTLRAGGEFDVARRNPVQVNHIEMQLLRERTWFAGQHTHPSDQVVLNYGLTRMVILLQHTVVQIVCSDHPV